MAKKKTAAKTRKAAKTPARRRTNRTAPDWSERFLEALRAEGTIFHACKIAKVGRRTVYDRRDSDQAFAAEMAAAIEDSTDELEREALRRGREGYLEPVIHQGRVMGDYVTPAGVRCDPAAPGARFVPVCVRKYSDSLLANLLRWRRYGDTVKHELSGPGAAAPLAFIEVRHVVAPQGPPAG